MSLRDRFITVRDISGLRRGWYSHPLRWCHQPIHSHSSASTKTVLPEQDHGSAPSDSSIVTITPSSALLYSPAGQQRTTTPVPLNRSPLGIRASTSTLGN